VNNKRRANSSSSSSPLFFLRPISKHNTPLTLVVNIDVPDDVILQRISDRWIHATSGRVYNMSYNRPRVTGIDDETGEPLTKRPDDNPVSGSSTFPLPDLNVMTPYRKHSLVVSEHSTKIQLPFSSTTTSKPRVTKESAVTVSSIPTRCPSIALTDPI
jgi:hypothetical protein